MNEMNIVNVQYINDSLLGKVSNIRATIDGREMFIPIAPGNRHYDEIMRQVAAGELTIADAE